jgi:hypothetical protein
MCLAKVSCFFDRQNIAQSSFSLMDEGRTIILGKLFSKKTNFYYSLYKHILTVSYFLLHERKNNFFARKKQQQLICLVGPEVLSISECVTHY